MYQVIINASSHDQLRDNIVALARSFCPQQVQGPASELTSVTVVMPITAEAEKATCEISTPVVEKKKRGRKPKAAQPEEAFAAAGVDSDEDDEEESSPIDVSELKKETEAKEATQAPVAPAPTFADAKAALKELIETGDKGVKAAADTLAHFKVQRISQVKEADYPEFIEKCKAALKSI